MTDEPTQTEAEQVAEGHTKDELRQAASDADVAVSGTKAELAERLVDADVDVDVDAEKVDPSVADLPASQQAKAAGKTGGEENVAGSVQQRQAQSVGAETTPLLQRPVAEQDDQTYDATGVLYDDGTRIDPGSYHKPGAALPPETEWDQNIDPPADHVANRVAKYAGFADEDVPDDVREAREAVNA